MKIFAFLFFLSIQMVSFGQTETLQVGDIVPDINFDNILNHSRKNTKLSDFKNKLIIFDFWATSCGSCIEFFPFLDSLQREIGDELKILLINPKISKDSLKGIENAINKLKVKWNVSLSLPIIYNDTIAYSYFKFRKIPYFVWIDHNRSIIGITKKDMVTVENIMSILKRKK